MIQKFFTPQEATRRLPYVRQIVSDILTKGQKIKAMLEMPHQTPEIQIQCSTLETQIIALMKELEDLGCYFKDWNFEIGLVDFPAIINGQEVLLCWRSDEDSIQWYHGIEEGFSGRKPLTSDLIIS